MLIPIIRHNFLSPPTPTYQNVGGSMPSYGCPALGLTQCLISNTKSSVAHHLSDECSLV